MTDLVPDNSPASGLVARVKDILLKPRETWPTIEGESDTIQSLYMRYVIPLAAIGPVANLIHGLVFGYSFLGVTYRPGVTSAVTGAIVSFALALAGVFILSLIIDALAPSFDGTKDSVKAFKVAAYSSTASWVAGIFGLLPGLGVLAILGIYSLYLLYLGLPALMKVSQDKAVVYIVVIVIAAIIVYAVMGAIAGSFLSMGHMGGVGDGSISIRGT